jgi:5'-methylthioadenosine phosphorylase
VIIKSAAEQGVAVVESGTMVVVEGPRFSTRAESRWFTGMGWEVINMTAYPEGWLARELELCYANVSLITDYDVGLDDDPDVDPVSHENVVKVFTENNERLRELLFAAIPKIGEQPQDICATALQGARF